MRGIIFFPFCLCCGTLPAWSLELLPALCAACNPMTAPTWQMAGLFFQPECRVKVAFDILEACESRRGTNCGDGLAYKTALLLQTDPRPYQEACLFTYIQVRGYFWHVAPPIALRLGSTCDFQI